MSTLTNIPRVGDPDEIDQLDFLESLVRLHRDHAPDLVR